MNNLSKIWDELHKYTININEPKNINDRKKINSDILKLIYKTNCQICIKHSIEYIDKNPISNTSKMPLIIWMFNFHNNVNIMLNKKIFSFSDFQVKYNIYRNI